jgi:2-polyprenyl-6-methoxyphenol hydroxylase-like FAD-dependent oxidoreductase
VGINLAIQDAVATANLLVDPLRRGVVSERDLARVQRRRALPTRVTQRVQLIVQKQLISATSDPNGPTRVPPALRVLTRVPPVRRVFSRFMAIGIRNEHVRPVPEASLGGRGQPTRTGQVHTASNTSTLRIT